jgi:hypothetical protein
MATPIRNSQSRRWCRRALLLIVPAATHALPRSGEAQAVQAVATAAGAGSNSASVLTITADAHRELETLAGIRAQLLADASKAALVRRIDEALTELRATLEATSEADLRSRYAQYQRTRQRLLAEFPIDLVALETTRVGTAAGTVPQLLTTMQNVVFTAGFDVSFSKKRGPVTTDGRTTTSSFSIATNLLGAAAGSAFDAIGAEGMKTYLTQNIAAGTAIPAGRRNSLTAFVGLGLGQYSVGSITLWPVINIEQTDTADTRTPTALRTSKADQQTWSAPTIGLAIVLPEGWYKKASLGKAGLIPTIGIRIPHYYPGDPFGALGALFSTKRADYVRAGSAVYTVGVALPLTKAPTPANP